MSNKQLVQEWFDKGAEDFTVAEFLFKHDRSFETVAFHIQQSAEKYLKGFLIAKGRELVRIHDLVKLLAEAIEFVPELNRFEKVTEKVTEFYFETRYPMGYDVHYSKDEVGEALKEVRELIAMVEKYSNMKRKRK